MTTRFFIHLKVSLLLAWLLPMDKSEHVNRHLTARDVLCFQGADQKDGPLYTGIELTASTFSENFVEKAEDKRKNLSVKFTLKIFNISVESLKKIAVTELDRISNVHVFDVEECNKTLIQIRDIKISELFGLNEIPCGDIYSAENSKRSFFKKKYETLLQGIIARFRLRFEDSSTHNASTFEKISVDFDFSSRELSRMFSNEGDFPTELDLLSMLKKKYSKESVEQISEDIIATNFDKGISRGVYKFWKTKVENLLMNKDLAPICAILDTLRDPLRIFSNLEFEILRYKWLLPDLSEEPKFLEKYYYEGLMKVYDPFRSVREYYLDQPEGEDKRPSICSELLIRHLRRPIKLGKLMLGNLERKSEVGIESACPDDSSKTLFLEKLSESVKFTGKKNIEIKKSLEETHGYFDKIVQEYQGIQGKSELKENPLQSLDFIFKKLSEPQEHKPSPSVEDCFKIFRLDQGCVLTNYLALCSKFAENAWDIDFIQLAADLLKKQRAESLGFVKKPIFEIIIAFDDFLRVKEYRESGSKEKRNLNEAYTKISKNIDVFFNLVQLRCAQTFYTNKLLNSSRRDGPVEDILSKSNETSGNKKQDEEEIFQRMVENLEKIVGPPGDEEALAKFCNVLIQECFGTHYENSKKLAGDSMLVESGAQYILSTVLEKLKKERDGRTDEKGVELLNHLIVIGELIDNLLIHSKNYRYLEILSNYYSNISKFSKSVRAIQGKDGHFGEHASYINAAVEKAQEDSLESTGEGGQSDDDSVPLIEMKDPRYAIEIDRVSFEMLKIYR